MTLQGITKEGRLPFVVKFGYGGAEGANSLTWTLFYIFFMFFATDVVKMNPASAGFIMMVATMWDAVTDPCIGVWSDRTKSRWGRRRPFILLSAVPFGIASWLLFTDFGLSPRWTIAYYLFMVILYFFFYTTLQIPYTALAAEMTQDYDERTNLVSYRTAWGQVTSLIAGALPLVVVKYIGDKFGGIRFGWSLMAAVFGLLCIPQILLTWRVTRGYELFPENITITLKDVLSALKNRSFVYTMGLYTFCIVGVTMSGADVMYYMKYYMGFDDDQSSIAFAILFGCTVLWIPLINVTAEKLGKRAAFNIFIGMWAFVQCFAIMKIKPINHIFFYILILLASAGVVTTYMLTWAMIPDVTEVDEYKTGQRREGLYYGFASFVQKASCAIALGINGIILNWTGYVPGIPQSHDTLFGIKLLYGWGTAFFLIISIILCFLMPLTREKHRALREALQLKKEGKEYDEKPFADIL
jgi:sugar (glycoside-pentoside-hexuronide) transporter